MVAPALQTPSLFRSGNASLTVELVFGQSTATSSYAVSPMKLLTPVARGQSVWSYTSSFGGGLVAGDKTRLEVSVNSGARCFLGTQSSTKVYRNPAALPCEHVTHATVAEDAMLVFAPEPVQAFADSHYTQRQEFHLAPSAGLVLLDWFSSGRAARGERWAFKHFESRNDIFVGGERALVDPILLNSDELAERMGRFNCLATLLLLGPPLKTAGDSLLQLVAARAVEKRAELNVSVSPVRGGVLFRVAGAQVEAVRRELSGHLAFLHDILGDDPWARKW
ncbi:MAG: urease accessory protein UreD [Verrucomicrobiota bacterium]